MNVRAKFVVDSITSQRWNPSSKTVKLVAQWDDGVPENHRFAKATPCGTLEITIDNPPAAEFFQLGRAVYIDFTAAE